MSLMMPRKTDLHGITARFDKRYFLSLIQVARTPDSLEHIHA